AGIERIDIVDRQLLADRAVEGLGGLPAAHGGGGDDEARLVALVRRFLGDHLGLGKALVVERTVEIRLAGLRPGGAGVTKDVEPEGRRAERSQVNPPFARAARS